MFLPAESGVLIVAGSWAGRGGLQRRLSALAEGLACHRRVTVLTWGARVRPSYQLTANGVRVVVVPSLLDWERDHGRLASAVNTMFSIGGGVLAALVLRRRWSVACAAGLHPEGTVAALAAWGRRRFTVTTWLVGPLGNAERLRRSIGHRPVLHIVRRAWLFVAETSEAATELTELGVPGDRVTVVGAGVDLDRFRPMRTARSTAEMRDLNVAVYAGRFDLRQKRLDLLLGAWEAAGLRGWELLLAGAGRDELVVRRLAERLPDVRVLEWQEDVPSLLSSASLFVLPTVAETSALSMLEGMACGLPGIVSSIDSLMARRPDGVSFAKNEPMAWIAALRDIDALGSAGREAAGSRARGWVELNADAAGAQARWSTLLSPVSG